MRTGTVRWDHYNNNYNNSGNRMKYEGPADFASITLIIALVKLPAGLAGGENQLVDRNKSLCSTM